MVDSDVYLPLAAGLIGALIGAGASIATTYVQARTGGKRAKILQATNIALEDYKLRLEAAMARGARMPPLGVFLAYYLDLLSKLEKKGPLTPTVLKQMSAEQDELLRAYAGIAEQETAPAQNQSGLVGLDENVLAPMLALIPQPTPTP
jgi:hypothetical protein